MIRFATNDDIPNIMEFINKYWRKDHIMSRDRVLFDFQHKWDDEISFVVSETEGVITGILGFIPYDRTERDVTLAIWKTNKTKDTMQGIYILTFLRKKGDIRTLSAPGIIPKTIAVYKFLGMHTGKMKQWYRLADVSEYRIAKVVNDERPASKYGTGAIIDKIDDFEQAKSSFGLEDCLVRERQLHKSMDFVERRYYKHPYFEYIKYGVTQGEKKLFIVLRKQECNDSALLRIIDCIGDHKLFGYFTQDLDRLLDVLDCEYADCFEAGINDDIFYIAGWKPVEDSGNIMPDYFAPFEQRNIDIYYMSEIENAILFKGDGDMDRPN